MRERPLRTVFGPTPADARLRHAPRAVAGLPEAASVDDLARAATAGDLDALGRLYDELVGPIFRYVAVRVRRREDAEDITHLIFERIVVALPRYKHNGKPFAAWVFRIARNAVIDHQRRARPTEPLEALGDPADDIVIEALSLRGEAIRELRSAMRHLTADQQEALALRYAAGLTTEEAAASMGRRPGTVRGLTFRAIVALRRQMTPGNDR